MSATILKERPVAARPAARAHAAAAHLADAPGRTLPAGISRDARARRQFLAMCTNPQIACEITLQPVDRYPLDAAICSRISSPFRTP
jgi:uroporphyrinogen decarboxylase